MATDVAPRLAPLLAQLDTSLALALDRMRGMDDAEFWWKPEPDAVTAVRDEQGRLVAQSPEHKDEPTTRTIAVLMGHLADMAVMRTDYTTGTHGLQPGDVTWAGAAGEALALLADSWSGWRAALAGLPDEELDVVGRCDMPWGRDPDNTILDVAWWMNRELIHHAAEIAFLRDLYARRA